MAKANAFADEARISKRFDSYDTLLADPEIDAVYIPLPQHLHCEYTIKAAEAKKHVIVEKPAALNVAEIDKMSAACKANDVLLMEAFMYHFRRVHNRAKEIVEEGTIGKLRLVSFAWSHSLGLREPRGFRLEKESGGGCLLDLGIYGVDWIRFITNRNPRLQHAYVSKNADGLDVFAHATYAAGDALATMTCGYVTDANYYYLSGEKGSIYAPVSLSGRVLPSVLQIHLIGSDRRYSEEFPAENAYVLELEHFAQCILENRAPFLDAENAKQNLAMIHEIRTNASYISAADVPPHPMTI